MAGPPRVIGRAALRAHGEALNPDDPMTWACVLCGCPASGDVMCPNRRESLVCAARDCECHDEVGL